jgi:eukaryotic-like serine/threonine-protein kinase
MAMSAWDAARWHAATGELDVLLGRTPAERAAALEVLRARDPRLADDVARLLRDHATAQAGGFLEQGPEALVTTASTPGGEAGPRPPRTAALPPGSEFGGYRVHRVLGRGGMGVVYDAEEIESGRRVALKVLEQRLGDERERERFEREGRLAASIDHEHCVFVFGAAEIHGVPAIAMELMQGTLADRLAAGGPLPPAIAVDMALQLVAGLQAAAEAGILHRDVKPSNCFVDADGVVKIGDFGISRSLRPAEETALSTRNQLAATPTYASPEQLRGAALDARADIYSLGATLYELVTGRRPFTAPDLMSLLMAVANDVPAPPHRVLAAVPPGLSRIILRCLAKRPEDRYASYAALAAGLAPYASVSPTPATLGRRVVANLVDYLAIGLLNLPILVLLILPTIAAPTMRQMLTNMAASVMLLLLYYGGCEALWARTPGKALLGLTLVDGSGRPPRPAAAFVRALLFIIPNILLGLGVVAIWGQGVAALSPHVGRVNAFTAIGQLVALATLFSTARRRNGYAGLHDLATGVRVVERRAAAASERPATAPVPRLPAPTMVGHRGSFAVLAGDIEGRPGWRPGLDERLRRAVWIRDVPTGTPPIAAARVALSRPTRLRWLAGRRTAQEAWDVYEGVAGVPIAQACQSPRTWSETRRWLADVAHELAAQQPGDQPPLDLDRVWILDSGRAKLLDDPTADPPAATSRLADGIGLVLAVARHGRARSRQPWPVSAMRFVDGLAEAPPASLAEMASASDAVAHGRAGVTRAWRGLSLAGLVALPLLSVGGMVAAMAMVAAQTRSVPVQTRVAAHVLRELERRGSGPGALPPADREAIEIVLASRYRAVLADPTLYAPERFLMLTPAHKTIADRILQRNVDPASVDAAAARPDVRGMLESGERFELPPMSGLVVMITYISMIGVALAALATAVATRGAVLRLLGFEIVTADGRRAGRGRVLARAAIAWSPLLVPLVFTGVVEAIGAHLPDMIPLFAAGLGIQFAGAMVALARPARGLQDRLAGTWIVPR